MKLEEVPLPEESDIPFEALLVRLQSVVDANPELFLKDRYLVGDIEYILKNSPEDFLQTFQEPTEERFLLQSLRGHTLAVVKHLRMVLEEGLIPDEILAREVENRLLRLELYLAAMADTKK